MFPSNPNGNLSRVSFPSPDGQNRNRRRRGNKKRKNKKLVFLWGKKTPTAVGGVAVPFGPGAASMTATQFFTLLFPAPSSRRAKRTLYTLRCRKEDAGD